MKNIFYLYLIALIFISPVTLKAEETNKVELSYVSGKVEVQLKDTEQYTVAEEGMQLETGDKVKTSNNGAAELSFNEDNSNLVKLSEDTTTEILLQENEKIDVSEGEVFSSISNLPSGSAFEIRTPTAVSGARGTDWVTKVTSDGTDVEAVESIPYVRHFEGKGTVSSEVTLIQPGQMTTVRKFERPTPLRPMMNARREKFQGIKQDIKVHAKEAVLNRQQRQPFNREQFKEKIKNRMQNNPDSAFKPLISRENTGSSPERKASFLQNQDNIEKSNSLISGKENKLPNTTGSQPGSPERRDMPRQQKMEGISREFKEKRQFQDKEMKDNKFFEPKENNQQKPDNKNNQQINNKKKEINKQGGNNKPGIGPPGGGPRGR